jgi:dolichyl-phosphate beta-glucosyltransferase
LESIDLSVVIPAFNEEARLGSTLERVATYLERRRGAFEVLVVDDGSSDRTAEIASAFGERGVRLIRLPENRGKGAALRAGVLASRGERVLLCDADLSTPIEDLERLEVWTHDAGLVLGSRAAVESDVTRRQPIYRELMGKTFNVILRLLGLVEQRDTQCGFKLMRGDLARELFRQLTLERFAYDVELVCLARDRGETVIEQGVRWEDSPNSRVHPIRDSFSMLTDVLRLRWRRLRER